MFQSPSLHFDDPSRDKRIIRFNNFKNIDWLGIIFLTCTLGGLIFGLLEGHEYGWGSQTIIASFVISVIGLFFFFLTERRVKSPIIDLNLFKESTFTSSSIIYMIFGFAIIKNFH